VSPATFSQLPRQSSPCLPTLQGTCTAPRPIRHSSLHARELARRWLVRPEILRFRLSPETDPVRDPEPLSTAILEYSSVAGSLRGFVDHYRLRPRTSPASRYRFSLPYYTPSTFSCCAAGLLWPLCVQRPILSTTRAPTGDQDSTRRQLMSATN
jgi:hypothetical protein